MGAHVMVGKSLIEAPKLEAALYSFGMRDVRQCGESLLTAVARTNSQLGLREYLADS